MLNTIFATKMEMSQAWSQDGKRLPITKLQVQDTLVFSKQDLPAEESVVVLAYGAKKLANVDKPIRTQLSKLGAKVGARQIRGVRAQTAAVSDLQVGQQVDVSAVFQVGDVVNVQGQSKGRGFAGAVKRHGFHGGPKTHGQSDRHRAVGSIGSGTTPGRIWKGKRMPGRFGQETKTVAGLVVVHVDVAKRELWLSGPVPGHRHSTLRLQKTGQTKKMQLDARFLPTTQEDKS